MGQVKHALPVRSCQGRRKNQRLTASECVAEITQRPLLALTCGDLGTTPRDVEVSLDSYLHLGEKWNAVVLLDEADIYLEKRDLKDVVRNSLVSDNVNNKHSDFDLAFDDI